MCGKSVTKDTPPPFNLPSTTSGYTPFGDGASELENYAWFDGNSGGKTHEVGGKRPNDLGLYAAGGPTADQAVHPEVLHGAEEATAKGGTPEPASRG